MRIMGIDTGYAIAGWGVIDKLGTANLKIVDYGAVLTESTMAEAERLSKLHKDLSEVIQYYKPKAVAIESLFFFKNQKTVMQVSQARGVILLTCINHGLEIFSYTPLQVKTAVTSYGRADKAQVQKMVKMLLKLKEIPKPDDAADALAIAIAHANSSK